jgi:ATP-independent RNA helicase DbpA
VEPREEWRWQDIAELQPDATPVKREIPDASSADDRLNPRMTSLQINGGRKNKLRAGDLLGALTAEGGIPGDSVGSIDLFDTFSYVAVRNAHSSNALRLLANQTIKGKRYKARIRK